MANNLQNETSLYLQQHKNNPVHWHPWGNEALEKAKKENKLILVSIGYSSCHWCHVMERESFEDEAVAEMMNAHFVSIKVDREERPDIDQIYMTAVQLMTNAGGWPLNCICLPDGRPIFGGTYFTTEQWMTVLEQVKNMWQHEPETVLDYAERLTTMVHESERLPLVEVKNQFVQEDLEKIIEPWQLRFDNENGGYKGAPKFPLPNNWLFLLRYGVSAQNKPITDHVHFTLRKIAEGGIFDFVNGGFSRYSVDDRWHIPHFEKMLYDNAQLISLYAEAFQHRPNLLYKKTVEQTVRWLENEMRDVNGGFYAAIDADSEGEEGKYYTFSTKEIEHLFPEDTDFVKKTYHIKTSGNWPEESTNVLYRDAKTDEKVRQDLNLSEKEFAKKINAIDAQLFSYRKQNKPYPAVDTKKISTWNALTTKALLKAYEVFGDKKYFDLALENINFFLKYIILENGEILHQKADSTKRINGFLDDYAASADAFIAMYQATFEEKWLSIAKNLCDKALELFYNKKEHEFVYSHDEELIAQKVDIMDNVIPSSTSMMVRQLHKLSILFDNKTYEDIVNQMLSNILPHIEKYGSAYSNWCILLLEKVYGVHEIALTGPDFDIFKKDFSPHYIPNKIFLGGTEKNLPLLQDKEIAKSKVYICRNKTCSLPQDSVEDAMKLINENRS